MWFSRRGANVAEKSSEVAFLYEDPGRHAQPHINPKPVFAEIAYMNKIGSSIFFLLLREAPSIIRLIKVASFERY